LALLIMSTCCSKHVEAWNKYIKKECVKLVINQKWYLSIFLKSAQKIQVSLKSDKNNHYTFSNHTSLNSSQNNKYFRHKLYRKPTHWFYIQYLFLRKSCRLWDNVEKYCTAGQATDDNMAHAQCMLDTKVYKHTLRICKNHCFSSATMVKRTRLNVTLQGLSYLFDFYSLLSGINIKCWKPSGYVMHQQV
jgi:hypothetical protein